jgi:hypothetical protein
VHAGLDAGVRLIDTALAYTRPGVESYAEQVVPLAGASRPASVQDSAAPLAVDDRDLEELRTAQEPSAPR